MAMGMEVVPTLKRFRKRHHAGEQAAAADADGHGEEDPERQVAVEEGEPAGDSGVRRGSRLSAMS